VQQESEAASELRQLIRHHLAEEMTKFRLCIEERLEQTACEIDQKLIVAESKSEPLAAEPKSPKSGKGGKKDKKRAKTPEKK